MKHIDVVVEKHTRRSVKSARFMLVGGTALALIGCAVAPLPLSLEERMQSVAQDLQKLFTDQAPVTGPISFYEAAARALKYNLDHRVAMLEKEVAEGQLDIAKFSLLPQVNARIGNDSRDELDASNSRSVATGLESLESSQSTDRSVNTAEFEFAWNILDFGVSFYNAKQSADLFLIREERRRKAIQNILLDVRVAYWRAVASERHLARIDNVLTLARKALAESRELEKNQLKPPLEVLEFQRRVLVTVRALETTKRQLVIDKTQLAALMNTRPGAPFQVVVREGGEPPLPDLTDKLAGLENHALLTRQELNEARYQMRISRADVRKEILRMLPGIELNASYNYTSNSFQLDQNWTQIGYVVTKNLIDIAAGPMRIEAAEVREELEGIRRMGINVAVLTQVNVAHQSYGLTNREYRLAQDVASVNERILAQMRGGVASGTTTRLQLVENEARAVLTQVEQALAYAQLQSRYGRVLNAAGIHPVPEEISSDDLPSVTAAVERHLKAIDSGGLPLARFSYSVPTRIVAEANQAPHQTVLGEQPGFRQQSAAKPTGEPGSFRAAFNDIVKWVFGGSTTNAAVSEQSSVPDPAQAQVTEPARVTVHPVRNAVRSAVNPSPADS